MRRRVRHAVISLASIAPVIALAACGSASPTGQAHAAGSKKSLVNVTVGAVGDNSNDLPIWVGQARGYYARQGLKVKLTVLSGATLSAALESGSVQFLEDSTASFLAGTSEKQPLIAVEAIGSGFPVGLIISTKFAAAHRLTPTTPPATIAKALIGSTGGSSASATTGQAGLFLKEFGVQPSQVKIATLSSPTADEGALKSNQVDWFLTSEPIPLQVQSQGSGIVVGTPANVPAWTPRQTGLTEAVVTSRAYANGNPSVVKRFVAATQAATAYILHHKQQVLPIAAHQLPDVPRSILLKSYSLISWAPSATMSAGLWRTATTTNVKIGVLQPGLTLTQDVNWTNKYVP